MVTHTRNLSSAFNPSKCTLTAVNTHPEQWVFCMAIGMAIGSCSAVKTNQWLGSGAAQANGGGARQTSPKATRMGGASGYISGRVAIGSSDFFSFSDDDFSSLIYETRSPSRRWPAFAADQDLYSADLPADSPLSSRSAPAAAAVSRPHGPLPPSGECAKEL